MKNSFGLIVMVACFILLSIIAVKLFILDVYIEDSTQSFSQEPKPIPMQLPLVASQTKSLDEADSLQGERELVIICDEIMKHIVNDDVSGAFQIVGKHSVIPDQELRTLENSTSQQLRALQPRYGEALGYEFIHREAAGDSAVCYTYILKCEKHALPWSFWFYRPKNKWFLNQFRWHDKFEQLFN